MVDANQMEYSTPIKHTCIQKFDLLFVEEACNGFSNKKYYDKTLQPGEAWK